MWCGILVCSFYGQCLLHNIVILCSAWSEEQNAFILQIVSGELRLHSMCCCTAVQLEHRQTLNFSVS